MTSRYVTLSADFDVAFARRTSAFSVRSESMDDAAFLTELFVTCSPLAELLPPQMLRQQADLQSRAHRSAHPVAMHRIIESAGRPIGRVMIDWNEEPAYLVDIAVLPTAQRCGAGRTALLAWLDVGDAAGLSCALDVIQLNPALALYRKLGFVELPGQDQTTASLEMVREARAVGG